MHFNRNTVAAFAAALLAGCGSTTNTTISQPPILVVGTATPPTWVAQGPFSISDSVNASASMALPSGGGFAGTLATSATLLEYTQVTRTLTNQQPALAPLTATRNPQDVAAGQILVYLGLNFDATVPSAPITMTMQIPSAAYVSGAKYYLAFWDPQRPTLGWQHGFAGPGRISTSGGTPALTFTATPPVLNRYEQYWLAIYMIPASASAPTPAPSVSPSLTPSPPPQTIANIQNTMSQTSSCSGTPCATGELPPPATPQPAQVYTVTPGVQSPSLSGGSTQLTFYPRQNEHGDVLYFTPSLGEYPLATAFTWDFWFMIDQPVWDTTNNVPLTMQALEFDFNDDMPGKPGFDYNFSSQCLIESVNGGPVWQVWGLKKDGKIGWIDSGLTCDPGKFTPMVWHHIVWTYRIHPDTLQTEYVSLKIDGDPPMTPAAAINPVSELRSQARPVLEVQFQQDSRAIPGPFPFTEWVDNVMLTFQ